MTKSILLGICVLLPGALLGQWVACGGGSVTCTTANVGVGGVVNPGAPLTVAGAIAGRYNWQYPTTGTGYYSLATNNSDDQDGGLTINYLYFGTLTPGITLQSQGYVGIGTVTPQHLLHVAGTIGAEEVIVSSTGADYVFAPGYRVAPLSEVAAYVKENHHLPDIPSAAEVKEKGVSLGDMQAKLLAKIEELTLHMIDAEKQNLELQKRIARLEAGGRTAGAGSAAGH